MILQQVFSHNITKDLMLKELFSVKLEIGIFKTLMQSLYLTMAMSYDEQLLKWLDVLSEGYFIKT